jgi:hypothetical protein
MGYIRFRNGIVALAMFFLQQGSFAQVFVRNGDDPSDKNFALTIAGGFQTKGTFQQYTAEAGATYTGDLFFASLRYETALADLFRNRYTKDNKFMAIPNFYKRIEAGFGINLYSRKGSSMCLAYIGETKDEEIWAWGDGLGAVYGQLRFGGGIQQVLDDNLKGQYDEPFYREPQGNYTMGSEDIFLHYKVPYAYVGWSKLKKFKKECKRVRRGMNRFYLDMLVGSPSLSGVYFNNGRDNYTGYYDIAMYKKMGWRIGYESISMNPFDFTFSLEAGEYPGIRGINDEGTLAFITMRLGFSTGMLFGEGR